MSDKTPWTPGPWKVEQQAGDEWYFGGSNGCQYAIYSGDKWYNSHAVLGGKYGEEEPAANAHLIAAAPELYEALEELADNECRDDDDPILISAREKARAALAKARGES